MRSQCKFKVATGPLESTCKRTGLGGREGNGNLKMSLGHATNTAKLKDHAVSLLHKSFLNLGWRTGNRNWQDSQILGL